MLLSVENLEVSFATEEGRLLAVDKISFSLNKGEIIGLVGESGCGKSVTALSLMRLLPRPAGRIDGGRIIFDGQELTSLPASEMQALRGGRIAMIFQEPMTSLNPVHRLGRQLGEVFRLHHKEPGKPDKTIVAEKSAALLQQVGLPDPERRLREYPHQISGGMRQRVMIAMALAGEPNLLIADEPTTALDVTIQAQILDLIKNIQKRTGLAVIFITHDLGVIAETCQRVCVMYAGQIVETAEVKELFRNPAHPYTQGLLSSIPKLENRRQTRLQTIPGRVPTLSELPDGCRFQNRCQHATDICRTTVPEPTTLGNGHIASCHLLTEQPLF